MKNENYYVGLDIGTDSVGYAVTDESYRLCKFKGEPMWGVTLFETADTAAKRRGFRTARRRLDRRQQRVRLLRELFAAEIADIDPDFFKRIEKSYLCPQDSGEKVRLFGTYEEQKKYAEKYPTIHHLISELMDSEEPHDIRLVYAACAWLTVHRGHFLNDVDKNNIDKVTDFKAVYDSLTEFLKRDGSSLPWSENINTDAIANVLKKRCGINNKAKELEALLFDGGKAPKETDSDNGIEYNYQLVIKLLCGGKVDLKSLFGNGEYAELVEKSVALNMDDEKLAVIMQDLGDDYELIAELKKVYDWSVLADILNGRSSISEAKVDIYEQHKKDLEDLKYIIKRYAPTKYNEVFRKFSNENEKEKEKENDKKEKGKNKLNNYPAYIGSNKTDSEKASFAKSATQEEFCKYVSSVIKGLPVTPDDQAMYDGVMQRLEDKTFMPKQVNGDNRVIPYQLYWYELNKILGNAKAYLPFLSETDEDGLTAAEKILSIFEFRVPYFVGPLKENPNKDKRVNHWMVRKAEQKGKIYPWNFENVVDLDKSEQAFIDRMTNTCTYLAGEDVLPKNSLIYSAFETLNEINNIKINGNGISVELKQAIFTECFMKRQKVTEKQIKNYLTSNNVMTDGDELSGIDINVKSSLKPFIQFKNLTNGKLLSYSDVENIIRQATYSEDKTRFKHWLQKEFPSLPDGDINYIANQKFKDFGRLSKKLLCGIEGTDTDTGETFTVIRALWETNCNLMQLLSDRFTFREQIDELNKKYYGTNKKSLSERLEDMYISNSVKRPIIRTLDILNDVVKVQGKPPKAIFVEMARGADENQKGNRTKSRLEQLNELYEKTDAEDVRRCRQQLEAWGDTAHNKLQSDKLFLYFLQLGKCLYTGETIDITSVISGDGRYNIEHIWPRCFVKDDSVLNNKILVVSEVNGQKSDSYPVNPEIQSKMRGYWHYLRENGLMTDEKYKRLIRNTPFTDAEKREFINRQLVETRQSTKAVAELLKEKYPETEIVYVKAGTVSDFRHKFELLKSRTVNDLHHAKDAYLNIAVGSIWHYKFSKNFWRDTDDHNVKPEALFNHPVKCGDKVIWSGVKDRERIVKTAQKNNVHLTKYAFCRRGGLFDQQPVAKKEGLVPLKKDRPTEIYGGYNKSTASFFVLVRYSIGKKRDVMFMPVELLYENKFLSDDAFALEYAQNTISSIWGKPASNVEFLLNKRIIKINTVILLNNSLKVCITGKSTGGKKVGIGILTAYKTSPEWEYYVKKLESFDSKKKKNANIVYDEAFDEISKEKNLALYDCYIVKLKQVPYVYRPTNPVKNLENKRSIFLELEIKEQVDVLLQIQGLFGRAIKADLSEIKESSSSGIAGLSSALSNWKKNYNDVRIIDVSASGLFENVSDNLLELL